MVKMDALHLRIGCDRLPGFRQTDALNAIQDILLTDCGRFASDDSGSTLKLLLLPSSTVWASPLSGVTMSLIPFRCQAHPLRVGSPQDN